MNCEDDAHSDLPSSSVTLENVKKIRKLILGERRITIKHVAEMLKIFFLVAFNLFYRVNGVQKKVSAKWVPLMLIEANKKRGLDIFKRNFEMLQRNPDQFCCRIVAMNETVDHFKVCLGNNYPLRL